MRRTFLILFIIFSCYIETKATDPNLIITEQFDSLPLKEVLHYLKKKYDLKIAYSDRLIRDVSISADIFEATIPEAFEELFALSGLSYEYIAPSAVIVKKRKTADKKTFNLNGEVIDEATGERMPFVYLFIQPENRSISTNEEGIFSINNVSDETIIRLAYLGYRDTTLYLNSQSKKKRLIIPIKSKSNNLEEIIITDEVNKDFKPIESTNAIAMNTAFANEIPQSAEPDVFRVLQLLPGVSGTNELSSGLFINGGNSTQNLVIFDGIPIYHVDHFFGYFSAINPYAIQSMRLFKGGFEAKFGGRASSILEFIGKDGNTDKVSGNISFNMLSANTSIEVPLNDNTTLFLSARRSYTDVLRTSLFDDIFSIYETTNFDDTPTEVTIQSFKVEPEFYYTDLHFKVSTLLGLKNRLSISYYDSQDILNYRESLNGLLPGGTTINNRNVGIINWGNVGTSLKLTRLWNTRHFTNLLVSYSFYESDYRENANTTLSDIEKTFTTSSVSQSDQSNFIKDLTIKVNHEWMFGLNRLELGTSLSRYNTRISSLQNDSIITFKDQPGSVIFTQYLQNKYQLTDNTHLNIGMRGNYISNTNQYLFEPRIGLNHRFNAAWSGSFSTGVYRQFVNQVNTSVALQGSRDLWLLSDFEIPSQKSIHYMAGITRAVENSTISVSSYYKTFDGLLDYAFTQGDLVTEYDNYENQFFEGNGIAKGLELMIKNSYGNLMGWVSYTLSRTEYKFDQLNTGNYFPADHDQTHELKIFGSYQLGPVKLFLTWYYGSGQPYSTLNIPEDPKARKEANKGVVKLDRAKKNNFRFTDYHRLDLGANYQIAMGKNSLSISGKIFNVYNHRNVYDRKIELVPVPRPVNNMKGSLPPDAPKLKPLETVVDTQLMGITPTLSVEFSF